MHVRILSALLLSALLSAVASSQTTPKDPPKDKETSKGPTKPPERKWPKDINGKDVDAWLKLLSDPDPAVREGAIQTLPGFGPDLRKSASKILIARMRVEPDPGVKVALYNLVGALGFDSDADNQDAVKLLAIAANENSGLIRLHALQALGMFGPKAHGFVSQFLIGPPIIDPSYEIRRTAAATLGRIAFTKEEGPNHKALVVLAGNLAKDASTVVRLEALQSLYYLGPPCEPPKPGVKGPLKIDTKAAEIMVTHLKNRIGTAKTKATESDKQIELWCRLVIIRFDEREYNDANLNAMVQPLTGNDLAVKFQALHVLSLLGEDGAKKINNVIAVLTDVRCKLTDQAFEVLKGEKVPDTLVARLSYLKDKELSQEDFGREIGRVLNPIEKKQWENLILNLALPDKELVLQVAALHTLTAMGEKAAPACPALIKLVNDEKVPATVLGNTLNTLAAMGVEAKPALFALDNLLKRLDKQLAERMADKEFRKIFDVLKPEEQKAIIESQPEEQFKKVVQDTIKHINDSKTGHPGGEIKKP